ncbi:MAG TPA: [FeFe] hydrogenase H-cluster radical SAM maturase HydE [Desulfotomaculum sp.]|nr:MAG: biotin synthase [Desulfotomaculum sp. BICA1-6]HBX23335.1 [FeFe] hydrogenase H-cluster radical SAM maturase HydE [Desulfotomaculum sp.]
MHSFTANLNKILAGGRLGQPELETLLGARGEQIRDLFAAANRVRRSGVGNAVHLRAIIEFSNYCRKNCLYCGLRRDNKTLPRYRLVMADILDAAGRAASLGYRTVVLQSGEDPYYSAADIARLVEQIKARHDLAVTLSLGEHNRETYSTWRKAGADRYLLKQETSDPVLFEYLKPDGSLQKRLQCLLWLKELGYQTGSGNMVGLPGQTTATLARDIALMRELDVEMAGIGPFLPHQDTPLRSAAPGKLETTLVTLAITRLCLPRAHLPATTSLGTLTPEGHKLALGCGANVIMPNLTPAGVRDKYMIYPQKADIKDDPVKAKRDIEDLLASLARPLATDYGHALT